MENSYIKNESFIYEETPEQKFTKENIIVRSIPAINKINAWEKSRGNPWIAGAIPLVVAAIIFFVQVTAEDYSLRITASSMGMQFVQLICLSLAAFLFYCGQKARKQEEQIILEARRKAAKESIVVTNLQIYGSTEKNNFSIPLCEIFRSDILRIENQNTKISDEQLRIITQNGEMLTFEFLENSTEISNTINSIISAIYNEKEQPTPIEDIECTETYTVKIVEYNSLIPSVTAIRKLTGMDYAATRSFLDRLPAVLAENLSTEKAEYFRNELEKSGIKFEIY